MVDIDINLVPFFEKRLLVFDEIKKIHEKTKAEIWSILEQFKQVNNLEYSDIYIVGSAALVLQDAFVLQEIRDVDIICHKDNLELTPKIDKVLGGLLPAGWEDRTVLINGVHIVSVSDTICSTAFNLWKSYKIDLVDKLTLLLLEEEDVASYITAMEQVLMALQQTHPEAYIKKATHGLIMFKSRFTPAYLQLNKNPQKAIHEILEKAQNKIN